MIPPVSDLPTTPKELVIPMTPVSPKNKFGEPVVAPSTPTLAEVVWITPITPAGVTLPAGPVEKLSPLIAELPKGAPVRCTQKAVVWVPKELPLWTSSVADVARLLGGCVNPMARGSPFAMLVLLSELKVMLLE